MKTFTWLRIILIISWVLIVLSIVLDEVLSSHLPELLQRWHMVDAAEDPAGFELVLLGIAMIAFGAYLTASIALFNRRRWGAPLFAGSIAVVALVALGFGPSVSHPFAEVAGEAQVFLDGLIVGLIYFGNALGPDDDLPADVEETFR